MSENDCHLLFILGLTISLSFLHMNGVASPFHEHMPIFGEHPETTKPSPPLSANMEVSEQRQVWVFAPEETESVPSGTGLSHTSFLSTA